MYNDTQRITNPGDPNFNCLNVIGTQNYTCIPLPGHFFFQAEDGIRDVAVTVVQTCALPILSYADVFASQPFRNQLVTLTLTGAQIKAALEQQWLDPNRPRILQVSGGFSYS